MLPCGGSLRRDARYTPTVCAECRAVQRGLTSKPMWVLGPLSISIELHDDAKNVA